MKMYNPRACTRHYTGYLHLVIALKFCSKVSEAPRALLTGDTATHPHCYHQSSAVLLLLSHPTLCLDLHQAAIAKTIQYNDDLQKKGITFSIKNNYWKKRFENAMSPGQGSHWCFIFSSFYSHAFSIQGSTLTGARFPGAIEKFIGATKFGILVAQISVKVVH